MAYVWVAVGGAIGSVARYGVGQWAASAMGSAFPWGTLIVNVVGSFIIGAVGGSTALPDHLRLLIAVGVCGGFTTFSAFSLQTLTLMQAGAWPQAGLNILGSVLLCLVAVWLGFMAAAALR
ncbi:MAG: fluoride efflux transporter CrcB [Rhodospirillaceae bacterium]|nr:fluoride efflux transporter CrcB [Rhodospirillaceae bacterium]